MVVKLFATHIGEVCRCVRAQRTRGRCSSRESTAPILLSLVPALEDTEVLVRPQVSHHDLGVAVPASVGHDIPVDGNVVGAIVGVVWRRSVGAVAEGTCPDLAGAVRGIAAPGGNQAACNAKLILWSSHTFHEFGCSNGTGVVVAALYLVDCDDLLVQQHRLHEGCPVANIGGNQEWSRGHGPQGHLGDVLSVGLARAPHACDVLVAARASNHEKVGVIPAEGATKRRQGLV